MSNDIEFKRKSAHALFGIAVFACAMIFGTHSTLIALLVFSILAIIAIHVRIVGKKIFPSLFALERKGVAQGKGAITLLLGITAALALGKSMGPTIILVLAVSDAVATLAGLKGKNNIPWNSHKSLRGCTAFLLTALPICVLTMDPAKGVALAIILTLVESLPYCDDNLAIPFAGVAFALLSA